MKIYWTGRDGTLPPKDAVFSWLPFSPDAKIPELGSISRITDLPKPKNPIPVRSRRFLPEKPQWIESVELLKSAMRRKELEKTVLARVCILECETNPDPFEIVSWLKPRSQNATLFCFANEKMAFLGATPEMLFRRNKDRIESEALAGTQKRGSTEKEDADLEKELLEDKKEFSEFSLVQTFLKESLLPLCTSPPDFSPLQIRKTCNVQHLYSQLTANLKKGATDADILRKIHPTPALCGTPTETAHQWIRKLEPFERGLYGGAIGWSTEESSEWAVAIRCCFIQGSIVYLYAGTGIVEASDPEKEWNELDWKLRLYDGIFK